jgi:acyl-CoA synthetase (AMP-forming)/AMP-acid ligase II
VSANDILTICWTSGTEAEPKAVPRSHNQWIWIGYGTVDGCELADQCHLLAPFPMVNMAGIGGMLVPWLQVCGKLVLHHPMNLPIFLAQLSEEQIHYTVAPPALLNGLLLQPGLLERADLRSIKNIGSGGAPLPPGMVAHYQHTYSIPIVNLFGSNEGASFTSGVHECPDPAERAYCFPRFGVPGYRWSSRIAAHMSTKLVDIDTKAVLTEKGQLGELAIKSPGIFPGYYKRPDLTRMVFDDQGYFYTGDLFEIVGEDGRFYAYVGRLKDVIKRGAMPISPEEIEYLLSDHPHVAEVAVVAYPDPVMGEKVCAVIVPREGQQITLDAVRKCLQGKDIAAYKLPEKLVIVERVPRNPVGKILKGELRQQMRAAAAIAPFNGAPDGR